jgi:hypothetical protein
MLGLYPFWVNVDPVLAKELLASIGYKCKTGQALDPEEQQYLADSIAKILAGLPAARALRLTAPTGRRRETLSERNILIHTRVEELRGNGMTKNAAFRRVAAEQIAAKRRGDEPLRQEHREDLRSHSDCSLPSEKTSRRKVGS